MKLLQDNFINEMMPALKAKAARVHESAGQSTTEDLELQLRYWFSKQYNIPMLSPILDAYTLPEMLLEFYLHTYEPPEPETVQDIIKEEKEDLAKMIADEFSEEDKAFMNDVFGKEDSWEFKEEDKGAK